VGGLVPAAPSRGWRIAAYILRAGGENPSVLVAYRPPPALFMVMQEIALELDDGVAV
jgi:hypothetical protein